MRQLIMIVMKYYLTDRAVTVVNNDKKNYKISVNEMLKEKQIIFN